MNRPASTRAAWIGLLGIGFVVLEWIRVARAERVRETGGTGEE